MNEIFKRCINCAHFNIKYDETGVCSYLTGDDYDYPVYVTQDFGCIKFKCKEICRLCRHYTKSDGSVFYCHKIYEDKQVKMPVDKHFGCNAWEELNG